MGGQVGCQSHQQSFNCILRYQKRRFFAPFFQILCRNYFNLNCVLTICPSRSVRRRSAARRSVRRRSVRRRSAARRSAARRSAGRRSATRRSFSRRSFSRRSGSTLPMSPSHVTLTQHGEGEHQPLHTTAYHCTAHHCTSHHCTSHHCTEHHCTTENCTAHNCRPHHCSAHYSYFITSPYALLQLVHPAPVVSRHDCFYCSKLFQTKPAHSDAMTTLKKLFFYKFEKIYSFNPVNSAP